MAALCRPVLGCYSVTGVNWRQELASPTGVNSALRDATSDAQLEGQVEPWHLPLELRTLARPATIGLHSGEVSRLAHDNVASLGPLLDVLVSGVIPPGRGSEARLRAARLGNVPKFPDDAPRQHHYRFAHKVLPGLLFKNLEPFRSAALAGRADPGLQRLWEDVAKPTGADSDGSRSIRAVVHECAGRSVVLVTLPQPEHAAEAHFIGIVLDRDDPTFLRYVVLEHSWDTQSQPRTVLGEWTRDGSDINFGDGPQPTESEFVAIVCERFTEQVTS